MNATLGAVNVSMTSSDTPSQRADTFAVQNTERQLARNLE
jgi:hypothetical protein